MSRFSETRRRLRAVGCDLRSERGRLVVRGNAIEKGRSYYRILADCAGLGEVEAFRRRKSRNP